MSQSDSKLFRSQSRSQTKTSKSTGAEYQSTVDEQLSRLEEDIRRLKIEFDVFFNGASKRPPYDTKGRVETVIKRLGDDRALSYAQRFRYTTLASRYNTFRDHWRRTMQSREDGRTPMATAKASAKEQAVADFKRQSFVCQDPHKDVELVKSVYSALLDAKKVCGEPVEDFSFPRFHRLIASQADSLKQRLGCERISFSIDVEGGRVSFKAKGEG